MKFKVGDKVRVIKCSIDGERCKNLNKVSTITEIRERAVYPYKLEDISETFGERELELVERQFTKSDLEDEDHCIFKNKDKAIKIGEYVVMDGGAIPLKEYNNKLEHNYNSNYDIVRVDRPVEYKTICKNDEILDGTEKKYLTDVIRPFRKRIQFIQKKKEITEINPYLRIVIEDNDKLVFPYITNQTMYKGMEVNRKYTLKELGL